MGPGMFFPPAMMVAPPQPAAEPAEGMGPSMPMPMPMPSFGFAPMHMMHAPAWPGMMPSMPSGMMPMGVLSQAPAGKASS